MTAHYTIYLHQGAKAEAISCGPLQSIFNHESFAKTVSIPFTKYAKIIERPQITEYLGCNLTYKHTVHWPRGQ